VEKSGVVWSVEPLVHDLEERKLWTCRMGAFASGLAYRTAGVCRTEAERNYPDTIFFWEKGWRFWGLKMETRKYLRFFFWIWM